MSDQQITFLNNISKAHRALFVEPMTLEAGTEILMENDQCTQVLFLVSGEISVYKMSTNGKVFRLYSIISGESCVLNLSCILSDTIYLANAVAETDIKCYLINKRDFLDLFNSEESVKSYVFQLISKRLVQITAKVEGIVLDSVEHRLGMLLSETGKRTIYTTHEQLANELGTAREVVSRQVEEMGTRR